MNNISITSLSSTSSNTSNSQSYMSDLTRSSFSLRAKAPETVSQPRVHTAVEETRPFTMPASVLGNGAFNKNKKSEPVKGKHLNSLDFVTFEIYFILFFF